MAASLATLRERGDPRWFFHATYLRATRTVSAAAAAGWFADPGWVARWDVTFAGLYLDALAEGLRGGRVPAPWAAAFGAADDRRHRLPPLRHVLLGMSAHINYDLPQALLAVISEAEFADPVLLARRSADHHHIDRVLCALIDGGQPAPAARRPRRGPRHALPAAAARGASKRFLTEARGKAWANARVLAAARSHGPAAYRARLAELERLAAARAGDVIRPGPVLLRLAARGFGVALRPGAAPGPAASLVRGPQSPR